MASDAPKILGQAAPATGYTAGTAVAAPASGHAAIVSSLDICNTHASASRLVRVYARIAAASAAVGNAIVYDLKIDAGDTVALKLGIVLGATDVLTVASDLGSVTFTAFGNDFTI